MSRDEDEWDDDREGLAEGYPYAYVWNLDEGFGEFGVIKIRMVGGGGVRIA